jgi:DNA polymerase III subunit beta
METISFSKDEVKIIKKMVSHTSKSVVPITDNILFNPGEMIVSDFEIEIKLKKPEINFSALIDASDYFDVVSLMPTHNIEGNKFSSGRRSVSLNKNTDISNFPVIAKKEIDVPVAELNNEDIVSICDAVKFTGKDDLRPVMQNVFLDTTHIVATNAHQLYFNPVKDKIHETSLLPKKVVELIRFFDPSSIKITRINNGTYDRFYVVCFDNIEITYRSTNDKYPNYKAVIPTENPITLSVNKRAFKDVLENAMKFVNKTTNEIRFYLNPNELEVKSENIDANKSFSEKMENDMFEIKFPEGTINFLMTFNGKLLLEIIAATREDIISIALSTPNRAGIINNKLLLMPVIIK